jgi:hypothetical protein
VQAEAGADGAVGVAGLEAAGDRHVALELFGGGQVVFARGQRLLDLDDRLQSAVGDGGDGLGALGAGVDQGGHGGGHPEVVEALAGQALAVVGGVAGAARLRSWWASCS